jgi:hypothetical protein
MWNREGCCNQRQESFKLPRHTSGVHRRSAFVSKARPGKAVSFASGRHSGGKRDAESRGRAHWLTRRPVTVLPNFNTTSTELNLVPNHTAHFCFPSLTVFH